MYRVTRHAMNCLFGVTLADDADRAWRVAADEALEEALRLERLLSRFIEMSDIARINTTAGRGWVSVSPETLHLLADVVALSGAVDGAFDPTVGPLVRLWRGREEPPTNDEIAVAQALCGLDGLIFQPEASGVGLAETGMSLDLGGVGKGYGVGVVAGVLAELGVTRALVDAGTSSAFAIGSWRAAVAEPRTPDEPVATLALCDRAVSVSGIHGQGFSFGGEWYGHVVDPRTGRPARGPVLAAVLHESPTAAEVMSTALLVDEHLLPRLPERVPGTSAAIWMSDGEVRTAGPPFLDP